jgi:hypothetical protein
MTSITPPLIRLTLHAYDENYTVENIPEGWFDQSASWEMDSDTFGYNMKFSTEKLRFILNDAAFIRKYLSLYGLNAEIDFIAHRRQDNWTYQPYFTGELHFAAGYSNTRDYIEVQVMEGGMKLLEQAIYTFGVLDN